MIMLLTKKEGMVAKQAILDLFDNRANDQEE